MAIGLLKSKKLNKRPAGTAPTGAPPGVGTPTGTQTPQPKMATAPAPTGPSSNNTPLVRGISQRLPGITSRNSEVMKRAQLYGNQQANRRGLLNSTMGIEAAQAAVIDRALEIARGDAEIGTANADRTSREALTREGYAHESDMQAGRLAHATSEREGAQDHQTRQLVREQAHQALESHRARQHDASENKLTRAHQSSESLLGRLHQTGEREGMQEFQAGENELTRGHQASESLLGRLHETKQLTQEQIHQARENIRAQRHDASENRLTRAHQTSEREDTQDYQSIEADLADRRRLSIINDQQRHEADQNRLAREQQTSERKGAEKHAASESLLARVHDRLRNDADRASREALTREGYDVERERIASNEMIQQADQLLRESGLQLQAEGNLRAQFLGTYTSIITNPNLTPEAKEQQIQELIKFVRGEQAIIDEFEGALEFGSAA